MGAKRGPARTRSEQELLAAALRAVDAGGLAALSLRRVAAEVGITANAVYTYFPTKQHLEQALADELLRRVAGAPTATDGRQRLVDTAQELRAQLLAHPAALPLVLQSPFTGPGGLALGERVLADLQGLGLDLATASRAAYALISYALGAIALDVAETTVGATRPTDAELGDRRRSALEVTVDDSAPLTRATADVIAQYNSEAQYVWGIELLLDAAGRPAAPPPPEKRPRDGR